MRCEDIELHDGRIGIIGHEDSIGHVSRTRKICWLMCDSIFSYVYRICKSIIPVQVLPRPAALACRRVWAD